MPGAPKGNTNAALPGVSITRRIRVADEQTAALVSLMQPVEVGMALAGYLDWRESPESDDSSWLDWIRRHTDYGQYVD